MSNPDLCNFGLQFNGASGSIQLSCDGRQIAGIQAYLNSEDTYDVWFTVEVEGSELYRVLFKQLSNDEQLKEVTPGATLNDYTLKVQFAETPPDGLIIIGGIIRYAV